MNKLPERPPSDWDRLFATGRARCAEDPGLLEEAAEMNRRYLFWDELRYRIPDPERRRATWGMMKFLRAVRKEPVLFEGLSLSYSLIPELVKGLHIIDRYLSGTLRIHNRTIRLEESYINNALMEEAIASSILEGAATTRRAAKEMLRKGKQPKNDSERMVLNNYDAMRFITEKKEEALSPAFILDTHRIVTKGTIADESVGQFRTSNDIVVADPRTGVVYHTPPDFSEIGRFVEEICRFANSDEAMTADTDTFIHPVIKGIILHYLIGYVHPFDDGNGRTARSIFYWYVLSRGYWLFEFMPISRIILRSKKHYALAYLYTEFDESDLTYFLKYNVSCIGEALTDLLEYLEKQQRVQNATKAIIREIRGINPRQAGILREMMEHPDEYFTIRQVMQMHGTVYQTARTDLLRLVGLGYVVQEKRGREYLFIFNDKSDLWQNGARKEN